MKNYKMINNYLKEDKYRKSFNKLAINTFDIDFERWYERNLFYDKYCCYSFIKEDEVIANVSVNKMNLVVDGQKRKALQLGTVMTQQDFRNQGLSAALINHIIEEYREDQDIIYLFANDTVLDFYPKFGFEKVIEMAYELNAEQLQKKEGFIKKLNINNEADHNNLLRLVSDRQPISQGLGVYKDIWPLLVYCTYEYKEDLYYLADYDVIVITRREAGRLHIYDVLSLNPFALDSIIEKIVIESDKIIEFHFIPELYKYKLTKVLKENTEDTLFVRPKNTELKEVLFPMTSHT